MIHLIGLGGAGCNMAEYAFGHKMEAEYTLVTYPIRSVTACNAEFIEVKSPPFYILNPDWVHGNIDLPDKLASIIAKREHAVFVAGLGRYTGTLLTKAVLKRIRQEKAEDTVRFILTLPFSFEGKQKSVWMLQLLNEYLSMGIIELLHLQTLRVVWGGDMRLSEVFPMVNALAYRLMLDVVEEWDESISPQTV